MTGTKTQPVPRLKMRSAEPDDPIYSRGSVIGGVGMNNLSKVIAAQRAEQKAAEQKPTPSASETLDTAENQPTRNLPHQSPWID